MKPRPLLILCFSALCLLITAETGQSETDIVLAAAGDILLSRLPAKRLLASSDENFPFSRTRDFFLDADIAFANLECPVSDRGKPYPGKPENITFRAPLKAVQALGNSGLNIVSLANNHFNDYGIDAMLDTMQRLETAGIQYCGAGKYLEEAHRPKIITVKGVRFAFLGYAEPVWSTRQAQAWTPYWRITRTELALHPSCAESTVLFPASFAGMSDMERMLGDIHRIRGNNYADFIVVSIHWGIEHATKPQAWQVKLAHAAVDAGADCILGHHPHVLQSIEIYKDKPVLYSMGNFVFDMAADATYQSAIFLFHLKGAKFSQLEIIPVTISRSDYTPAPADKAGAALILSNLQSYSANFKTTIQIKDKRGYISKP